MKTHKIILKLLIVIISTATIIFILKFDITNFVNQTNVLIMFLLLGASFTMLFFTKRKKEKRNNIIDFTTFIFNTLAVLMIITNFIITPARVDGSSMVPTYKQDDRVFIYVFNPKLENNDIVVYSINDELIIKRLVAQNSDVITLKKYNDSETKYQLYINDELYLNKYNQYYLVDHKDELFIQVGLLNYQLTEDEIILLGDNEEISIDSRKNGIYTTKNIVGKVLGGIFG